jgi:hypothetical protein
MVIKKLTIPWYAVTTLLYMAAIPMTIWVFPSTTLILSIFVLFGGFTASMASLASALITAEQDKSMASLEDQVSDDKVVPSEEAPKSDATTDGQTGDQGGVAEDPR